MSLAQHAAELGLHRVGARPPFFQYVMQTWNRRRFITTMAAYRVRASLEQNRLGILWLVLQPALNAAVYGSVFYFLQGASRPTDYVAHVTIGVFLFQFFSRSLSDGAKSITGNRALVQSLAFPRLTLPLAEVAEHFISLMPSMGLLFVILPFLGHPPTWSWLLMIPLLALFTIFNAGIAMIAARLTVHFRDITQILPYVSRILFYTSGVLFDVNKIFAAHPVVIRIYDFMPIYQVLTLARGILMGEASYNPRYWIYFTVWALLTFSVGTVYFWVAEERYGRD